MKKTEHIMNDEEIHKMAGEFVGAWNRREVRAIAPFLTDDMEFVNAVGFWWRGPSEVLSGLEKMNVFGATITPDPGRVRMVLPDAAIYSSTFTVSSFVGPDGTPRPEQHGVMTLFMVNKAGRWLIAAGQITAINEQVIAQIQSHASTFVVT
jgi:uncharacterized protein (TIGR02246 family)